MRKVSISFCLLVMLFTSGFAAPAFNLEQLQGAWWSDLKAVRADFAIYDDKVSLDSEEELQPCRIEGDILIFELGHGDVRNRIISLEGDRLVLEYTSPDGTSERTVLTRATS